jgi:hypothetical protein
MRIPSSFALSSLALGFATASAACGANAPETDNGVQATEAIFGVPATSQQLDAIGAIDEVLSTANGTVTLDSKCTGTLIGPHTVLTAGHCATKYVGHDSFPYTEHRFRTGADSAHPTHEVRIVSMLRGPQSTGGIVNYGSDVAIFQLADDITDRCAQCRTGSPRASTRPPPASRAPVR